MTDHDDLEPLAPEEEAAVQALLASLPDPPLPADVERRIVDAVGTGASGPAQPRTTAGGFESLPPSDEAAHSVLAASAPSGRWRSPWLLQGAAVVVVLALVGAVAVGFLSRGGDDSTSDAPLALSQPTAGPITVSGRDYTGATLAGQVRGLVVGTSPSPVAEAQSDAGAGSDAAVDGATTTGAEVSSTAAKAVTALITNPKTRQACIDQLASVPGALPVAIDVGTYDGKPAAVIVLPDENNPAKVAAWVVGPTCSSVDNPFPYRYERVTRP